MAEGALMSAFAEPHHVWTWDDLLALPEEIDGHEVDWRCYEILDGALIVSPSAAMRHEVVSALLRRALDRSGDPAFITVGPISVGLDPSYLNPDLVIVTVEVAGTRVHPVPTTDALAAIEIVSPSSRTMDRFTKPAVYAANGIAVYLRVETEPNITLTAYELCDGDDAYTEVGTWGPGETAHLNAPFAADIPIDAITPQGGRSSR
jgi:Uma2 family endonuclease